MNLKTQNNQTSDLGKKPNKFKIFRLFFGLALSTILFAYLIYSSPNTDAAIKSSNLKIFLIALALGVMFALIIWLVTLIFKGIAKFFKLIFSRPLFATTGILLAVMAAAVSIYMYSLRPLGTEIALSAVQENLAELALMKIETGLLKDAEIDWEKISSSTLAVIDNLNSLAAPDVLKDYRLTSLAWSGDALETKSGGWEKLKEQPGDFRLIISDAEALDFLSASVKKIAELKEQGDAAIKNKDKEAMKRIAANLLIQKHWLNGILHSSPESLSFNLINTTFAKYELLQLEDIPEVGAGCAVDTVVGSPTYGKCKNTGTAQAPIEKNKQEAPEKKAEKIKLKLLEELKGYTPHSYSSDIRKTCFTAYNGKNFCVPEVMEATTDIYEAAKNYAAGKINISKSSSWDKVWEEAADIAGIEPSMPSAAGGHEIPSDGAISQGEKDTAPPATPKISEQTATPAKTTTKKPAPTVTAPTTANASWDGTYKSPNLRWATLSCIGYNADQQTSPGGFAVFVENNKIKYGSPVDGYKYAEINPSGYVSFEENSDGYIDTDYYQFYFSDGKAHVDAKSISRWTSMNYETGSEEETVCTRTGTAERY